MPNVDDHGLEVLKKAAQNLDPVKKRDYALQVVSKLPFAPPWNTDYIRSTLDGLVQTIVYKTGGADGTVLKTITITYDDCDFLNYTVEVSSP